MRAPLLAVLLTLAFALGGATVWMWLHTDAARVGAEPRGTATTVGGAAVVSNETVMERAVAPTPQDEKPAELPLSIGVDGLEDGGAALPAPRADFSAQYAGWTRERLETRLDELELSLQAEQERLLEQRFESGHYRAIDIESSDGSGRTFDVLAMKPPDGEVGLGRLVIKTEPADAAKAQPAVPGGAQFRFATLPRDSYPAFYAHVDERDWVRLQLAEKFASER